MCFFAANINQMNLESALRKITAGETLSQTEAEAAMGDIMEGTAKPLQVAATLGALRMRGGGSRRAYARRSG